MYPCGFSGFWSVAPQLHMQLLWLLHRRRHADGTYTSDVSSYLQDQAAKEFVSWLKTGRGRRDWRDPAFAIPQNNATILTDSVPLYVSQSVLDFFLGKILNALTRSPVGLKLLKEILKCVRYVSDVWSSLHDMIYFFHISLFFLRF